MVCVKGGNLRNSEDSANTEEPGLWPLRTGQAGRGGGVVAAETRSRPPSRRRHTDCGPTAQGTAQRCLLAAWESTWKAK